MPGGVINTGSHPALLWPGIYDTWGQVYQEHKTQYTDLWDVHDSEQAYERLVQITGFGLPKIKTETGPGTYDSEVQGVVTTIQHVPYSLGYIVSYEEQRDNLYKEVATRRTRSNAFSVNQGIEQIAVVPYNDGFTGSFFTTGDGLPLFSAAHKSAIGGTFSNLLTPGVDISEAALEDMCIQIMGATDDQGKFISLMPESLHIPRQEWFNANRIMGSVLQANAGTNAINVLKATNAFPKGIFINTYFTAAHAWFVRTNCPSGMYFFWRDKPDLAQDNDFDTKNAKALCYFRCSVGTGDPRAAWGSNGP